MSSVSSSAILRTAHFSSDTARDPLFLRRAPGAPSGLGNPFREQGAQIGMKPPEGPPGRASPQHAPEHPIAEIAPARGRPRARSEPSVPRSRGGGACGERTRRPLRARKDPPHQSWLPPNMVTGTPPSTSEERAPSMRVCPRGITDRYSNQKSKRSPLMINSDARSPTCSNQRKKAWALSGEMTPRWNIARQIDRFLRHDRKR